MDVSNYFVELFIKVMNDPVMTPEEDKRFLSVWLLYLCEQFCRFANGGAKISQALLHEIMFFSAVHSAAVKC